MKYIIAIIFIGGVLMGVYFYYTKETPDSSDIVYEPYALLCSGEYEYFTPGGTDCFSITRQGKAFASTSVTLGLKFFGEISTTTSFEKVSDIVDSLAKETDIDSVSILRNNEYVIHSKIGKILIKGPDLEIQQGNILSFLKDQKGKVFEYIDARHGNSIFFK